MGERNDSESGAFPETGPGQDHGFGGENHVDADHLTHLRFLENMERVDRAIHGADDLEQMLKDVLDTVLSVFNADRAFLLYPCDPDAESFSVPMESTRPEYPGARELGFESFSVPSLRALSRDLLDTEGPISLGSGSQRQIPPEQYEQFSIKSMLCMPIFPKVGAPWITGIHQCSRERAWTQGERELFQEIGRRIADSLSSFITLRDLRQSEERYRALFESSADPTLLIDGDTFVACNDAAVRMLRYNSKEELLEAHPWELSPEFQANGRSSREKAEEILASMPIERSRRFEWIHRRADGELFPAEVLLTYIPVGDKHLINTVWRDLTELKKAEKEARRLRSLLTNIINSMPSVLIGVDADASVTQWNRMAQDVTGISPEDAEGKHLAIVFPQLADQLDHVQEAIAGQESLSDSKIPATVDGETRFSDITIYPLISNGTEGAVIRIDDVTERVQVEEMMVQSEKMLSVGGLAAGMAHEINNPLAGIMQSIQVILDRISPGMPANQKTADECGVSLAALNDYLQSRKVIDLLEGVHASGRRAARIVENMLSFSRKSSMEFAGKNLAEIIDRTLELAANDYVAKRDLQFRDISIQRCYDPDLPDVPCEETEIQQVILNLLKNAAHAMVDRDGPHEPPCLTIRVSADADMARIEIQDNGPGMTEAVRRRVFEPFYTTKGVGVGTGLGLSVSYFIITEKHRGTLSVESTLGEGTRFIIRLPLERPIIRGVGGEDSGQAMSNAQ